MLWKEVQSEIKIKKRSRFALFVLLFLGLLIVLSFTVQLTKNLFSSWKTSSNRNYTWSGEFNINLVTRTPAISLFSYNPKQRKVAIINIPDETYLEVPRGFGKWQLRAVYGLGGDELLKETVANFLGLPIDGFLESNKPITQLLDKLNQNPFSGLNILSSLKTDLTLWELIKLHFGLLSVRFDKVKIINLDSQNILNKEKLPDETDVFTADPVRIDSILTDLVDSAIVSEHKTIAVLNATEEPQLAQKRARLISNMGGNVIITGNARERVEKTQLAGKDSLTLKRLRQIFGSGDKIKISSEDIESSRAEIILLLGEDDLNR